MRMMRICKRRRGNSRRFTSLLQHRLGTQQRGLRDGAWPASQEAHHCLTRPSPNFLCGCFFAPKLRRQAFLFFVSSYSNFREMHNFVCTLAKNVNAQKS
ncbi:hypothetical protein EPR50_G00238570 [Perca flavescens]|uniref:Uncharacterized protein n=1 Tax=Perca flavescens TaxID=8167 RepID=A0A484BYH6_PERFV|nr:hypothetical protein EPR50_G00238570 [Perca flavescens]